MIRRESGGGAEKNGEQGSTAVRDKWPPKIPGDPNQLTTAVPDIATGGKPDHVSYPEAQGREACGRNQRPLSLQPTITALKTQGA